MGQPGPFEAIVCTIFGLLFGLGLGAVIIWFISLLFKAVMVVF